MIPEFRFLLPQYLWLAAGALFFVAAGWLILAFKSKKASFHKAFYEQYVRGRRALVARLAREGFLMGLLFLTGVLLFSGFEHSVDTPRFFKENVAMCWVLDTSASMRAEEGRFGPGGRLSAAKKEIREFLAPPFPPGIPQCLVIFAGDVILVQDQTPNYDTFLRKLDLVSPEYFENQGTNFEWALKTAIRALPEHAKAKRVIFLSDGDVKDSKATDVTDAIAFAKAQNVIVDTITVGFAEDAIPNLRGQGFLENEDREPQLTEPDPRMLAMIAKDSGGTPHIYNNTGGLKKALDDIFGSIKTQATAPVPSWESGEPALGIIGLLIVVFYAKAAFRFRARDVLLRRK